MIEEEIGKRCIECGKLTSDEAPVGTLKSSVGVEVRIHSGKCARAFRARLREPLHYGEPVPEWEPWK